MEEVFMDYETLLVEKEGNVAVVKLNRPPVNSLNAKAYQEIYDCRKVDT
jgi:enoyl-CoA hydratase/carnithine racemase